MCVMTEPGLIGLLQVPQTFSILIVNFEFSIFYFQHLANSDCYVFKEISFFIFETIFKN